MTLKEKIDNDFILARKEKNEAVVSVLGMLKAAILNSEIAARPARQASPFDDVAGGPKEFTDQDVLKVLNSEVKKRNDSILEYEKGGREDLVSKEKFEVELLQKYLPEEMPFEELKKIVEEKISELGATSPGDFGKVMGAVVKTVSGRASGETVSRVVKESLKVKSEK